MYGGHICNLLFDKFKKKNFRLYIVPGATIEKKHRSHRVLKTGSSGIYIAFL